MPYLSMSTATSSTTQSRSVAAMCSRRRHAGQAHEGPAQGRIRKGPHPRRRWLPQPPSPDRGCAQYRERSPEAPALLRGRGRRTRRLTDVLFWGMPLAVLAEGEFAVQQVGDMVTTWPSRTWQRNSTSHLTGSLTNTGVSSGRTSRPGSSSGELCTLPSNAFRPSAGFTNAARKGSAAPHPTSTPQCFCVDAVQEAPATNRTAHREG